MICKYCKTESNPASRICPSCGEYMGVEGEVTLDAIMEDAPSIDLSWSGRTTRGTKAGKKPRRKRGKRRSRLSRKNTYQKGMVNWAKVAVSVTALLVVLAAGAFVYLRLTPGGQIIMARMGRDASADAYWTLGTEYLDQGYVARAIESYQNALAAQPERPDLADKLLLLAEGYEAASRYTDAEEVYKRIYTEVDEEHMAAYRQHIDLLLNQGQLFPATDLMQTAFEKTGDESFFNQRSQLVPLPPVASLASGRYMFSRTVEFSSPQGYDVVYATGEEELPEAGTLYTGPITMEEGTHDFRAVAVSSALISDEMSIRYTITLPSPLAPRANQASGSYERPIRVSLRNIDEDKDVRYFYTIDGTRPTTDSPEYTGEPILLPGGKVLLRAIALNRYGKTSNELNIQYDIKAPFKKYFRSDDQFKDFKLLVTTAEAFIARMGQPESQTEIEDEDVGGKAAKLAYPWGEARFFTGEDGLILYYFSTNQPSHGGPRSSAAGQSLDDLIGRFRTMGQLPNARGDRGIYYDMAEGYAHYKVASDDPDTGLLSYVFVGGVENGSHILEYDIQGGRAARVTLRYVNRKLSLIQ
ncbi:MAG: chitobiase/beta-hexosaminidase C-terminal domain-containing protein [Eubacteriales bacterium]|nr:chitobiase/beta-hexosaminidase C-terminal domain-containing protein [Eubacteriales bacterium]